jgi:hypothetical protein
MTKQEYVDYAHQTHELMDKMVSFVERSFEDKIPHALPRLLVLWQYWSYIRGDWNAFAELHRPPGIDKETQDLFYKVENDLSDRIAKLRKKAGKAGEQEINEFLDQMKTWCTHK